MTTSNKLSGVNILIVDDEKENCEVIKRYLAQKGAVAKVALNGHDALDGMATSMPQVILLDVRMPGIDGIETLRRIRKISSDIIVVMITAFDSIDTISAATTEGADSFIRKPVIFAELEKAIVHELERRTALRERELARAREAEMKRANIEIARALAKTIDEQALYGKGHYDRVARYSIGLGKAAGLNPNELDTLEYAALLHDIGVTSVPVSVLNKPGALTAEEYDAVKTHAVTAGDIIGGISVLKEVCGLVRHHHERVDGKGYPDGLSGDQLSVSAKIILIADAFDAMTSNRPYRKKMAVDEALARLRENSGTQFDAGLVEIFISEKIYTACQG